MKSIVVAYDRSRAIGAKNKLLWGHDMPADLKHFKKITMGGSVIMGSNTYSSIGRALPGRENIVVSTRKLGCPDCIVVNSIKDAYDVASNEQFIIGGASIYKQTIDDVDIIYATEIDAVFPEADTFFPTLGDEWIECSRQKYNPDENNKYPYSFVTYKRR